LSEKQNIPFNQETAVPDNMQSARPETKGSTRLCQ